MVHRINRQALFHHDLFAADRFTMHLCTRRRSRRERACHTAKEPLAYGSRLGLGAATDCRDSSFIGSRIIMSPAGCRSILAISWSTAA
jgi:hypothetical protein